MSDRSSEELGDRLAELEGTIEELRSELAPRRGPLGLPRPPTPGEVLRFTDEYAIPAAIAVLEANVRMLELLQRVVRAAERGRSGEEEVRERAGTLTREAADRLDRALAEVESAIETAEVPRDAEARRLLGEARRLNAEVRDRAVEGVPNSDGESEGWGADAEEDAVEIDVEAELESIREEVEEEGDETGSSEEGSEDGDGDG